MSEEDKALVPIDEQEVLFYGDTLIAVLVEIDGNREVYVPVKTMSDALGLSWSGQSERLRRDKVLSEVMQLIRVTRINSQRGNPISVCIPLKFVPGWLFGISVSRVKPELQEKIHQYRLEAYDVLATAFLSRSTETAMTLTI